VVYENVRIDTGFRADLIVEDKVIVEVKSVELLASVHRKQLLTYLRLADKRLGCSSTSRWPHQDGIARIVNGSKKILTPSRQAAKTDKGGNRLSVAIFCGSQGGPCDPTSKMMLEELQRRNYAQNT